jgi:hypothetical protein
MRTTRETKAVTSVATKIRAKCEMCGRKPGPQSCRPIEAPVAGWYCQQWGLQVDPVRGYIYPEPDPILANEQAAIDKYEAPLEAARKTAQEWSLELDRAREIWLDAYRATRAVPKRKTVFRRGVPESVGGSIADLHRAEDTEKKAREDLDLVEKNALKARAILGDLERRADRDRTIGRLQDRGQ